jgi:hypothetical protein
MRRQAEKLRATLLDPEDVLVDDSSPALVARGLRGRAFCPTPRALALLRGAGAEPEPHPTADVLRAVNSRAFAASLGPTMPGAAFVTNLEAACARLREAPPHGDAWRVKRAFGMAGRGQRIVASGAPSASELAFVRAGLAEGGVQIEPNVAIVEEYAIHGMLADGAVRLGAVMRQLCDAQGAWIATEAIAAAAGTEAIAERLVAEAGTVAEALARAGYFGPFGVDAYTYRDEGGGTLLQPLSEVNARYSMGFAAGFG